jgi:hypothetical protein
VESFVSEAGASRVMLLVVPPAGAWVSSDLDGVALAAEQCLHSPGLAERFEPDGNHRTPTVDYVFVVEGEIHLETDAGTLTALRPGDICIQNGTRHAWRNLSDHAVKMYAVPVGAPEPLNSPASAVEPRER